MVKAPLRPFEAVEQAVDLVDLFHQVGVQARAHVESDRTWVVAGEEVLHEEDYPGAIRVLTIVLESRRV